MTVHAFGTDSPAQAEHPPASSYRPSLSPDLTRVKYGALLIVAAFLFLGGVFGVAVSRFTAASDVTAVVGSVTTVVGTIVGAFFGVQAGSSGKEAASMANGIVEAYLDWNKQSRIDQANQVSRFLESHIEQLKKEFDQLEHP